MSVTPEDVRHVAQLARLALSTDEELAMAADLSRILGYVEQLNELDLEGVPPMERVADRADSLREDVVERRIERADALASAPDADDRYFRVPRVME